MTDMEGAQWRRWGRWSHRGRRKENDGSSPDTNLHPHTGPERITVLIHQDKDLSCIYTWFNTALKLEWNICLHCYPCLLLLIMELPTHLFPPTVFMLLQQLLQFCLLGKSKGGSLKSSRLWCSWSGFFCRRDGTRWWRVCGYSCHGPVCSRL